jgi:hypothetical protein
MCNSISRTSLVSLLIATYARLFKGRWNNVRAVKKASSLMSEASVLLSGPILIVRLNKPEPGIHNPQVPSVVKVPLPDRVVPESMMSNISALSGTDDNEHSGDSGEAERDSGLDLKLFDFIAESVFAFIPEPCSGSSRNAVRLHRGMAFIWPRIPHIAPQVEERIA